MSNKAFKDRVYFVRFSSLYIIISLVFLMNTAACSFLVYQPSKKFFYDPGKLGFSSEDIYLETANGTKLHGWLFRANPDLKERGTIVQFHGNAENISTHFLSLVWLTNEGYNLFTFDYSGYGHSEGYPSQSRLNIDAMAAIEYAVEFKKNRLETLSDKGDEETGHRLFLYGQSLGGAVLLRALHDLKDTSAIDALITESSFLSYRKIAREKLSLSCLTWPFQPLSYLFSDRFAPIDTIKYLPPLPLLVIHGENDMIIPIHHGEEIFDLANGPKQFWRIKNGRHIDAMLRPEYRKRLLEYLEGEYNLF